ncbi:hypothetical protein PVAND_011349 [Polypedilum vanderplanki]|uniref:Sulfatase N-terminal domain-containing protein n=1 Tax=Polypedilum vanderplanki TaxID=319348 RepID=A0A9J6CIW0_POLVA|nr:hypothetical protein PVAND_011349 [Polypedilum vanderplanki]
MITKVSNFFLFISYLLFSVIKCEKPNIVIILADDLGYNDVSFHGSSEIPTPNLDALCYNGVILNRFYTTPLCTPSRSSLMTGKYSTKLGMNHYVIPSDEPWGLPLNEKIIPEYFKEAGYKTALIGKWHLGFFKKSYTPLMRGFDYHYGYLGPYIGYYDHSLIMLDRNYSRGFDMRNNFEVENVRGKYATDVFTDEAVNLIKRHNTSDPLFLLLSHLAPHAGNEDKPLEASEEVINKFAYIKNEQRRTLAAMINIMDDGIGRVVEALNEKGIMNNTIIMFLSDNGGPTFGIHSTEASNSPLRGQKGSVWEGGTRVPACIYSPLIKNKNRVTNEFMYITDILPTMAAAANISITNNIDGINQFETISNSKITERKDILYNIESVFGFSAIMSNGFKLVNGSENMKYSGWFGSSGDYAATSLEEYFQNIINSITYKNLPMIDIDIVKKMREESKTVCDNSISTTKCNPIQAPCLFDIINDPCEKDNLAEIYPDKVKMLIEKLNIEIQLMVPTIRVKSDPLCDPKLHNWTWTWWRQDDDQSANVNKEDDDFSSRTTLIFVICFIFIIIQFFIFFIKCKKNSENFTIFRLQ